jgi:type IV pilus assembly protein PilW
MNPKEDQARAIRAACLTRAGRRQAGLGMIELLVVMLISLLMLMGLFSIVYGSRNNYLAQNQLGQLQDSERLAMSELTNIVQTGGYFPNPTTTTATAALPAGTSATVVWAGGQALSGAAGDQIYVRYAAGATDGVMDCNGQTNTSGATATEINTFYVNGSQQLVCQVFVNGVAASAAQPLVNGVTAMAVLYGVDTNADFSADRYMTAAQVTAATAWNSVVSVRITLTFANPLTGAAAPGAGAAPLPTLTRTIDLLNKS